MARKKDQLNISTSFDYLNELVNLEIALNGTCVFNVNSTIWHASAISSFEQAFSQIALVDFSQSFNINLKTLHNPCRTVYGVCDLRYRWPVIGLLRNQNQMRPNAVKEFQIFSISFPYDS